MQISNKITSINQMDHIVHTPVCNANTSCIRTYNLIDGQSCDDLDRVVHDDFMIVKYNKQTLQLKGLYHPIANFRSVVYHDNKLVSFSPPKSITIHTQGEYNSLLQSIQQDKIIQPYNIQQFIDGTMIQMFYTNNEWIITTKSILHANTAFYKGQPNFNTMFYETLSYIGLDISMLKPKYVYSFVLQHPQNRIVTPVQCPTLFLVALYEVKNNNTVYEYNIYESLHIQEIQCRSNLQIPNIDTVQNINLFEKYTNAPYYIKGIVIYHQNQRFKIHNNHFKHVKQLKGNQTKFQYQFYVLKQSNRVNEYLQYFPEFSQFVNLLECELRDFALCVYAIYVDCFIHKNINIINTPKELKPILQNIHKQYTSSKIPIHYTNMMERLLASVTPSQLTYAVNHPKYSH